MTQSHTFTANADLTTIKPPSQAAIDIGEAGLAALYLRTQGYSVHEIERELGSSVDAALTRLANAGIDLCDSDLPPLAWPGHKIHPPLLPPRAQLLTETFETRVRTKPQEPVLIVEDIEDPEAAPTVVTAFEFAELVREIAARLAGSGIEAGDRIAIDSTPSLEATVICHAAWQVGAIVVILRDTLGDVARRSAIDVTRPKIRFGASPALSDEGCAFVSTAGDSDQGGIATWIDQGERTARSHVAKPEDPAVILMTSGSTGVPKAITLSHRSLIANSQFELFTDPPATDTRYAATTDLAAVSGLRTNVVLPLLGHGPSVVLSPQSRASGTAAWAAAGRHRVTHFQVIPSTLRTAVALGRERLAELGLDALTYVASGTGVLHEEIYQKAQDVLNASVADFFGMSETAGAFAIDCDGSIGHGGAVPYNVLARIVRPDGSACEVGEQGHLRVFSDRLMAGLWQGDQLEAREPGWFTTGDIAMRRPDGTFIVCGRSHDLIKSVEGEFLSPVALENVALRHASVNEAIVISMPPQDGVDRFAMFVEADPAHHDLAAEVSQMISDSYGAYARPSEIVALKRLPRAAHGKPDRASLKARILARAD